jgi:hypothetical protein
MVSFLFARRETNASVLSTNPRFLTSGPLALLTQTNMVAVVDVELLNVLSAGRLKVTLVGCVVYGEGRFF